MSPHDSVVTFGSAEAWTRAAGLVTGALRGRWRSMAAITLLFAVVGVAAAWLLPRTYSAETRLLVTKNYVMPALAHPKRAVPIGSDAPTQSAPEFILSRQALRGIIAHCRLLERWERERPAVLRLKDRLRAWLKGPLSSDELEDAIFDLLAKRIRVAVQNEVVGVSAAWGDPRTVVEIVDAAVAEFLEARRRVDVQAIADTSRILTTAAERERARVEEQLAMLEATRRRLAASRALVPAAVIPGASENRPDGLGDLRERIADAQRVRVDLERRHADEVTEAEARLAERLAALTEGHPDVPAARRVLERLREEPASLAAARSQEAVLLAEYRARAAAENRLRAEAAAPATPAIAADLVRPPEAAPADGGEEDDAVAYQRSLFKSAVETYQDLLGRLANVQIELQTAQAAFAYRYSVTAPARLPKEPDSPNGALVVAGALVAGVLASVAAAMFAELRARALLSPVALRRHLAAEAATAS